MAARPAARLRRIRYVSLLGLALGVLAVLVGMLAGWPGLARLAVAGWAVAIAAAMAEPIWSIGARLDPSTGEVLLTRVHPKSRLPSTVSLRVRAVNASDQRPLCQRRHVGISPRGASPQRVGL